MRSTFRESLILQNEEIVYISKENNDIIIVRTSKTSINKSVLVFKHHNRESGFNSILIGI